jgi:hypothetical protein
VLLVCENKLCERVFERKLNDISPHNYCSKSCAAIVNNKKYPKWHSAPIFKICKQCGQKFKKSTNNKKYCSRKCMGKSRRRTPEDLIKIIKETAGKLKRVPSRRELRNINDSCRKIFGSWNNAVLAADFVPNRSHDDRMYKRSIAKALDGHLCDSASEAVVDNFLTKHKIAHKRNIRYPLGNYKADWGIEQKNKIVFIEYFGLANDSPRYDRSIKKKQNICRKYRIKLIEIYPKDLYPEIKLKGKLLQKLKT